MWIVMLLVLLWAGPGLGATFLDQHPKAQAVWQGQSFRSDDRFLLRMEGSVIRERWTFPGPIEGLEPTKSGLRVTWKNMQDIETFLWAPGQPTPRWILVTPLRNVVVSPKSPNIKDPGKFSRQGLSLQQIESASRLDPTNPWYHLHLADLALERKQPQSAAGHFRAIFDSPHLTFADYCKLIVPLEQRQQRQWADEAASRAKRDFQARGYRPELLRGNIFFHLLFDHPDHPFPALGEEDPEAYGRVMGHVIAFMPHLEGSHRFWKAMAERDTGRAEFWNQLAKTSWQWDIEAFMMRLYAVVMALFVGAFGALFLFSLHWAARGGMKPAVLAVLIGTVLLVNGFERWTIEGAFRYSNAILELAAGSWGAPTTITVVQNLPASDTRQAMLAFAEKQALGEASRLPAPDSPFKGTFGPIAWRHFAPVPAISATTAIAHIPYGDEAMFNRPDAADWLWLLAWGGLFLLLRRIRFPAFLSYLLPGMRRPQRALAPVVTTLWLGALVWIALQPKLGLPWGEYSMAFTGLTPVGTLPDTLLLWSIAVVILLGGLVWNGWIQKSASGE